MKGYKAFPLCSYKKAWLIIYSGVEKKEFHYETVLAPNCQQKTTQSNLAQQALLELQFNKIFWIYFEKVLLFFSLLEAWVEEFTNSLSCFRCLSKLILKIFLF